MSDSLIISWEQKRLVLLSGSPSSAELRIEKLAVLEWPADTNPRENRQASGLFLKEALRDNGLTSDSAIVSPSARSSDSTTSAPPRFAGRRTP